MSRLIGDFLKLCKEKRNLTFPRDVIFHEMMDNYAESDHIGTKQFQLILDEGFMQNLD